MESEAKEAKNILGKSQGLSFWCEWLHKQKEGPKSRFFILRAACCVEFPQRHTAAWNTVGIKQVGMHCGCRQLNSTKCLYQLHRVSLNWINKLLLSLLCFLPVLYLEFLQCVDCQGSWAECRQAWTEEPQRAHPCHLAGAWREDNPPNSQPEVSPTQKTREASLQHLIYIWL